jgi:endonuclease YncB( thermonuclease family)
MFQAWLGALLFAAVLLLSTDAAAQNISGRANAVEGDVLVIDAAEYRITGIDAPDRGQRCVTASRVTYDCFEMSRLVLARLLESGPAECTVQSKLTPTQYRATCTVNGFDIGAHMVLTGWAMAHRRISQAYVSQEVAAISRRRGLWDGRAEPPWIYRDRMLAEQRASGMP